MLMLKHATRTRPPTHSGNNTLMFKFLRKHYLLQNPTPHTGVHRTWESDKPGMLTLYPYLSTFLPRAWMYSL